VPAYALAGTLAGLVSGAAVWAGSALLWPVPVQNWGMTLGFGLAGALMMALVGMLIGLASERWDHLSAISTFVVIPLTFLSGAFAPVQNMPEALRLLVQANPIFYAIDGFRAGWLGQGYQDPAVSALVLAATIIGAAVLVSVLFARGWRLKA
jgi:ABC-2 type transport system permease protein